MQEIQRQIRKLATCENNRRVLRSQRQFALSPEDPSGRFDDLLQKLESAEKDAERRH